MSKKAADSRGRARPRVKGDAKREKWRVALKDAVQTRFGRSSERRHAMFASARVHLAELDRENGVKLPFIGEFSGYPLRTRSAVVGLAPRAVGWEHTIRLFGKTPRSVNSLDLPSNFTPATPETEANVAFVAQMERIVDNLNSAYETSLARFCAPELDALRKARSACVERMKQWDAHDVDVDALCKFDADDAE